MTARRRSGGAARALMLSAMAAACGPVAGDAPLDIPLNDCPTNACDAYKPFASGMSSAQCKSGYCQVTAKLDFTLVVTPADTSYYAPGSAFVLPAAHLFDNPSSKCPSGSCTTLPGLGIVQGDYLIDAFVSQTLVKYYIGEGGVVLPVTVRYRRLTDAGAVASSLGLPLDDAFAQPIALPGAASGPLGGPSVGYRSILPPGTYARTVIPEPPFDGFFPPDVSVVSIASGLAQFDTDHLQTLDLTGGNGNKAVPRFNVRADAGQRLDGFALYARDPVTEQRVSNAAALGDANRDSSNASLYHVQLNMNRHVDEALQGVELVLEPPRGSIAMPTLVDSLPFPNYPNPPSYPALSPPATVRGFVATTVTSDPVAADVVFTATKIYVAAGSNANTQLTYTATTTALPASDGAPARYSIVLPRGEYQVTVTPRDPRYARVVVPQTFTVDPVNDPQDGKNLAVSLKRVVRGSAFVSDGRPLAHADVVALPAAASFVPPASPAGPPALTNANAPRAALTSTDSQGTFTLDLDPGAYDIAVKPAQGSRLPWVVLPSRVVGDSSLVLDPVMVPAPVPAGLTVLDPSGNAVAGAMVRAYAIPTGGTAYVEIGRALTDAKGHYDLFLAGAPH